MDAIPTPPNPFVVDGASTFVVPSLLDLYFVPGDWIVYLLARYLPALATAVDLGPDDYGSAPAGFAALAAWLFALFCAIVGAAAVRDADRALTRGARALYADVCRRIRMAIALAKYRRERRAHRTEPAMEVREAPSLSREERSTAKRLTR